MNYWIFKVAKQKLYPDEHGSEYVYDNTHSVKVQPGDIFIYLDKNRGYSFTATGRITKVAKREPTAAEASRTAKVRTVFTAHLGDIIEFTKPLTITPTKKEGLANRARLGIDDANLLGWSQSMARLSEDWYKAILDLAESNHLIPVSPTEEADYSVPDAWGKTKVRKAMSGFTDKVLERHSHTCVVCGTRLRGVFDAAHLSPYTSDIKNRANPANGICICTYCHRALDRRLIGIKPNGELLVSTHITDAIAKAHFDAVNTDTRKKWLEGVKSEFLELTVTWFKRCAAAGK
jgi:HNH endonuclease/EVE domain